MAYFRSDIDIIVFFLLGGMKMSGSAELFNKKNFFFYLVGSPKVGGAGDGKHKKKYGHPYIYTLGFHFTLSHGRRSSACAVDPGRYRLPPAITENGVATPGGIRSALQDMQRD